MVNYKCRGCKKTFKVKRWINYIESIILIYPILQDRFGNGGYYCDNCFDNLENIEDKPKREEDIMYSDELASFKIEKLTKEIKNERTRNYRTN